MTCNDGKTPSDGEALEVSASRDASDDPEAEITSPSDHVSQRDPTITKTAKPNSADVLSQDGREQAQPPVDSAASALGFFRRRRLLWATLHVGIWIVMTGWWITGLVLHRHDLGWLVPFLVWLGFSIRLLTIHVRMTPLSQAVGRFWNYVVKRHVDKLSARLKLVAGMAIVAAIILVGTFGSPGTPKSPRSDRAVGLFGLVVFLGGSYATSRDRKNVNFQAVIVGVLMQFLLGLFVLRTQTGYDMFDFLGYTTKTLLSYAGDGTAFLTDPSVLDLGWFLLMVVPPIIFFVAFVHLLYHWGLVQWLVRKFAALFFFTMGISGAEAVVAAASPFLGQGESAVLVKDYLPLMTRAEVHQIMTSGFATIAGSVFSAYVSMGISPSALMSSCVMSIPASIAVSKLRYPEVDEPLTRDTLTTPASGVDSGDRPFNSLQAFTSGSWLGIKIAGMIVAAVLCILALLGLANGLLGWWGSYLSISDPDLSVQLVVGYLFYPVAFLLGVERNGDLLLVAQLIGIKIVANEFVAYGDLTHNPTYASLSPRSHLIASYALCGFGNIAAIGVQIGVLSQLAPGQGGIVAEMAVSSLISGVVATLTSACIAGMLMA